MSAEWNKTHNIYINKVPTHLCVSCSKAADAAEPCVSRTHSHLGGRAAPQTWLTPEISSCSTGCWEPALRRTSPGRSTARTPPQRSPTYTDVNKNTGTQASQVTDTRKSSKHTYTHAHAKAWGKNKHTCRYANRWLGFSWTAFKCKT